MNFSSTSEETRGLVGFIIFVIFLIILFVAGFIGLLFIGNFFNKVDKLKHSDFSIGVQNAFQIRNQQLFDILKNSHSNRSKLQNDTFEIDKIFLETKLNERLKSRIVENFDKINNLRITPTDEPGVVDVSFTIKTIVMPRNSIKDYSEKIEKILHTPGLYKDLDIDKNMIILSDLTKPIILDAVDSDKFVDKPINTVSLKLTKNEPLNEESTRKNIHNREINPNEISYYASPLLEQHSSYEYRPENHYQAIASNEQASEIDYGYAQKIDGSSEYNQKETDQKDSVEEDNKLKINKNEVTSTSSTTKRRKKKVKTTTSTTEEIIASSEFTTSIPKTVNEIKSSTKTELKGVRSTTISSTTQATKLATTTFKNSTRTSLKTRKFKSLDEFLMNLIDESALNIAEKKKI